MFLNLYEVNLHQLNQIKSKQAIKLFLPCAIAALDEFVEELVLEFIGLIAGTTY